MKLKKLNILYNKETFWNSCKENSCKENIKVKTILENNQKEILEQLWDNRQIIEKINNLLKADTKIESLYSIDELIKLQDLQYKLYNSSDRLQHTVGLILDIRIRQYNNPQELIDDVSIVLNEKTIPSLTKILFLKSLKKCDFNLKWTNCITALNHILINYPQYWKLFSNYIQKTIDPQDWKLAVTNIFLNNI